MLSTSSSISTWGEGWQALWDAMSSGHLALGAGLHPPSSELR